MNLYERFLLPHLINLAMKNKAAAEQRAQYVPLAAGTVLEVGIGSGLNIPFYGGGVSKLFALDPSPELRRMAHKRARGAPFEVEFVGLTGEDIPLDDAAVDTVVITWTLCSIADAGAALSEMRRVLKPGGRLVFIEHGRAPEPRVVAWQDRLTPLWRPLAGGCHLNRKMDELITGGGFRLERLETGYVKGPKPFTFLYKGVARP